MLFRSSVLVTFPGKVGDRCVLPEMRRKGGLDKSVSEPAEIIVRVETQDKIPQRFTYTDLEGDPTRGRWGGSLAHARRTQLDVSEIWEPLRAG